MGDEVGFVAAVEADCPGQGAIGLEFGPAVAMMADHNSRTDPQGVTPDVAMSADGEPVVDAARQWLSAQPACRPRQTASADQWPPDG